ncbi:Hypothetical protein D9617_15g043530 [Elsinoe fawcettii]|nr:Hypothetical protein D9617_15g043530 [Elsinoe fawcettii]
MEDPIGKELYGDNRFSDLILICGNRRFRAHQFLIARNSAWISKVIEHAPVVRFFPYPKLPGRTEAHFIQDGRNRIVMIRKCEPKTLHRVVEFCYLREYSADDKHIALPPIEEMPTTPCTSKVWDMLELSGSTAVKVGELPPSEALNSGKPPASPSPASAKTTQLSAQAGSSFTFGSNQTDKSGSTTSNRAVKPGSTSFSLATSRGQPGSIALGTPKSGSPSVAKPLPGSTSASAEATPGSHPGSAALVTTNEMDGMGNIYNVTGADITVLDDLFMQRHQDDSIESAWVHLKVYDAATMLDIPALAELSITRLENHLVGSWTAQGFVDLIQVTFSLNRQQLSATPAAKMLAEECAKHINDLLYNKQFDDELRDNAHLGYLVIHAMVGRLPDAGTPSPPRVVPKPAASTDTIMVKKLQPENEEIKHRLRALQEHGTAAAENLRSENENLNRQLRALQEKGTITDDKLKAENEDLKRQLRALQDRGTATDDMLQAKNEDLKRELRALQDKSTTTEDELADAERYIGELRAKIKALASDMAVKVKEAGELRTQVQSLQATVADATAKAGSTDPPVSDSAIQPGKQGPADPADYQSSGSTAPPAIGVASQPGSAAPSTTGTTSQSGRQAPTGPLTYVQKLKLLQEQREQSGSSVSTPPVKENIPPTQTPRKNRLPVLPLSPTHINREIEEGRRIMQKVVADKDAQLGEKSKRIDFLENQLATLRLSNAAPTGPRVFSVSSGSRPGPMHSVYGGGTTEAKVREFYNFALKQANKDFKACPGCSAPFHTQFRGAPDDGGNTLILKCTHCDDEVLRWKL